MKQVMTMQPAAMQPMIHTGRALCVAGAIAGRHPAAQQRGVALFIALVVLLMITVLGIEGMQTTTLGERMAASVRDRDLAFQAAEAALREGEFVVSGLQVGDVALLFSVNANGRYLARTAATDDEWWQDADWTSASSTDYTEVSADFQVAGVRSQPRFIIEHVTTLLSQEDLLNISNLGTSTLR